MVIDAIRCAMRKHILKRSCCEFGFRAGDVPTVCISFSVAVWLRIPRYLAFVHRLSIKSSENRFSSLRVLTASTCLQGSLYCLWNSQVQDVSDTLYS